MKQLYAAGLMLAMTGAHAATQTVDCGRLLDVKSGAWRERVSIVVENGVVKSVGPMTQAPDAVLLDTSEMTIEQATDAARRIVEAARARWERSR